MVRVAGVASISEDASGNDAGDVEVAQRPRGRPEPGVPTPEEYARPMLTHVPFRRWCRWCVMARARNERHLRLPPFSRKVPRFCSDYCFVRNVQDEELLTLMIGKLYPSRAVAVIPCDANGPDAYVVDRMCNV